MILDNKGLIVIKYLRKKSSLACLANAWTFIILFLKNLIGFH